MNKELELAMKPKRNKADQDAARAEKRAYDRAYRETRKEMGKAEGAAAGVAAAMSDSSGAAPIGALERARARAIGEGVAAPAPVSYTHLTLPTIYSV